MKINLLQSVSSALILSYSGLLNAAQEINPTQVMGVVISNQGLTRVSVEEDSITDVFVYPQELQNHMQLHQSGHVFIAPEGLSKPLYLTVMTKRGQTQDLKINVANKNPKPIILKAKPKPKPVTAEEIDSWFNEFGRGIVPIGFQTMTVQESPRDTATLTLVPLEAFRNATHEITVYVLSLKADVSSSIPIDPASFCRNGEAAKVLASSLEPGASTKLLILKPLGE
jgi:TraK protein